MLCCFPESRKDHENLEPGEDSVDGIKEENKDQKGITACDLFIFSRIILVYYCKCCNLIGYSTRYLFLDS